MPKLSQENMLFLKNYSLQNDRIFCTHTPLRLRSNPEVLSTTKIYLCNSWPLSVHRDGRSIFAVFVLIPRFALKFLWERKKRSPNWSLGRHPQWQHQMRQTSHSATPPASKIPITEKIKRKHFVWVLTALKSRRSLSSLSPGPGTNWFIIFTNFFHCPFQHQTRIWKEKTWKYRHCSTDSQRPKELAHKGWGTLVKQADDTQS